jgi:hypothetical protein
MGKIFFGVRDVDEETIRKLKLLAVQRNITMGEAINQALNKMIRESKKRSGIVKNDPRNIFMIKPIKIGKRVRWSEEVDEILYG